MALTPEFIELQQCLLGRYSLERELGRGGMGIVYLARDVRLDRPVAIKVLHPALAADTSARERFLHEARTAARLAHPHIISIFSVETKGSFAFLVMALVDGETLGSRIRRRGALPWDEAERVLREIAWALGYAHASGVVHRDLTLENVLLERSTGRALLADFGLAHHHALTESGPRFGTPGYLAPEIIRGEAATPSSDIYALGVVSWTALAGQPPFAADTPAQLLAKHMVQPPPPLGPLAGGASRRLVSAIESCLAKDPEARPADTTALLAQLERAPEPIVVAPPLQNWFTRWERVRSVHALVIPSIGLPVWAAVYALRFNQVQTANLLPLVIGLVFLPILIQVVFEFSALRALHAHGFGVEDIRSGLAHWRDEVRRRQQREGIPPLPGRVVFDLTVIGILFLFVAMFVFDRLPTWLTEPGLAQYWQATAATLASIVGSGVVLGISTGLVSPGIRLRADGLYRRTVAKFWRTHLAKGMQWLATLNQKQSLAAPLTLHRNTELVLGLAVDDLWAAIPEPLRQGLGDIPRLAHTLQASATELRDMLDHLESMTNSQMDAPNDRTTFTQVRDAATSRHRETIVALERLRLQLLRLVATRQQSSELTQQVAVARQLQEDLLRELTSHNEVRRLLGRDKERRSMSATPSPTPA